VSETCQRVDSKKYTAAGGWSWLCLKAETRRRGIAQTCLACYKPAEAHEFVFARYPPTP
jgi:hypothetical protein